MDRWEEGFDKLRQFVDRERHSLVPVSHREGGFALGRWINKQRSTLLIALERASDGIGTLAPISIGIFN